MTKVARLLLMACCLALAACAGPKRAEISGTVTFNGKPVPAGRIYFNPDFTKSNDGPQGFADIIDGKFDTAKGGRGACGGPTVVVIEGFDGAKEGGMGKRLFGEYRIAVDLPKETSTRNFDVPASAAEDLPKLPVNGGI